MRLFKYCATLALLLVVVSPVLADVALPDNVRKEGLGGVRRDLPYSRMSIESVEGMREARLQIPRSQLGRLAASAGLGVGGAGTTQGGLRGLGTIVAGVFLSLAFVLTGLLVVRSRRGVAVGRAAALLLVCTCAAGAGAVASYANAGPPPGYLPQDPGTLIKAVSGRPLAGSIRVEVVEEGSEIKLLVPARSRGDEEE